MTQQIIDACTAITYINIISVVVNGADVAPLASALHRAISTPDGFRALSEVPRWKVMEWKHGLARLSLLRDADACEAAYDLAELVKIARQLVRELTSFVNLTPHEIVVRSDEGKLAAFPPSGNVARVEMDVSPLPAPYGYAMRVVSRGAVSGLPEPTPGVFYIVSGLVRESLPERLDLVSPDTGPSAVRNERGHIEHVTGFLVNSPH